MTLQKNGTVALNHKEIKKGPQITSKIEPFMGKYYWKGMSYLSEKDDWKKLEKNNLTILLNVLYALWIYVLPTLQNIA